MSINIQKLKTIDLPTKSLVIGYVRENETLLVTNTNFPPLITYIIFAYYQSIEYFKHYDRKRVKALDITNQTIKNTGWYASSYGAVTINMQHKFIHKWRFKIAGGQCGPYERWRSIGIDESCCKWKHTWFYKKKITANYSLRDTGEKYICGETEDTSLSMECKYTIGDIITMTLDVKEKKLWFRKNNDEETVTFKLPETEKIFRMVVYQHQPEDKIRLLSYELLDPKSGS
eukprot:187624_1